MIAQPCKNQEKPNRNIENKFAGVRDIFKRLSRTVAIGPRIIYPYRILLFPNKKTLVFQYATHQMRLFSGVLLILRTSCMSQATHDIGYRST